MIYKNLLSDLIQRNEIVKIQKQPPGVFLEISQNFQENNCARVSFLIKLQA